MEQQKQHDNHRDRVRKVKSSIDMTTPSCTTLDHLRVNPKRALLLEERYLEIDRENRSMLRRMSDVAARKNRYDNGPMTGNSSLTGDERRIELKRITKENHLLMKRIQTTEPVYNVVKWDRDHQHQQRLYEKCCCRPVVIGKTRASSSCPRLPPLISTDLYEEEPQYSEEPIPSPAHAASAPAETDQEPTNVLSEGHRIAGTPYLVEMSTDGRNLVVTAYDAAARRTLELVVKEKNHRTLYRDACGDYSRIAERLGVDGDRLTLQAASPSSPGAA